ncbi:hypothetical protein ACFVU0_31135 [Streptomyces sp. NPDC058122]|uniref:hypothetical protein n=1 Tax=Streptomyces sp. NPDC058122 TaxID=3346349 RepID=UPI0036E6647C
MRALATRPQRLALACALISAATLGTVSASAATAASASDRTTVTTTTTGTAGSPRLTRHNGTGVPPKGGLPSVGALPVIAYRPTSHAPGDVNTADDAFAACMRDHGQKYFPVFHASKDKRGRVRFDVRMKADKAFDPASQSYRTAQKACAPILKKAGITFSTGSGLPPTTLPGKPGKGSAGGSGELPGFHTEKGEPGAPDGPSLSGVTENA